MCEIGNNFHQIGSAQALLVLGALLAGVAIGIYFFADSGDIGD